MECDLVECGLSSAIAPCDDFLLSGLGSGWPCLTPQRTSLSILKALALRDTLIDVRPRVPSFANDSHAHDASEVCATPTCTQPIPRLV
jgi:hypothetical protein